MSFRFVSRCCDAHDTGPGSRRRRTGFFAFAPKPILVIIIIILGLSVQCYMEFIFYGLCENAMSIEHRRFRGIYMWGWWVVFG